MTLKNKESLDMAIIDDVGSFPLPERITRDAFNMIYPRARAALLADDTVQSEEYNLLKGVIMESFEKKVETGIDVVTYPQHYDMHSQFLDPIDVSGEEPFLIKREKAIFPEIEIIKEGARVLFEKTGKKLAIKACVTGPIELYTRTEFGHHIYKDVLENLSKSVNFFLKNSIVDTEYIGTESVSLDEPSIGYTDLLNVDNGDLIDCLEDAVKGINAPVQIHLHSMKSVDIALETDGITSITGEFAATPENMEFIRKKDLDRHDKFLRAGVTRTNIDSIIAEQLDSGREPSPYHLIDDKNVIQKRVEKIYSVFGERISSWGPDCGLGSWPSQDVAGELLRRTAEAVRESFK